MKKFKEKEIKDLTKVVGGINGDPSKKLTVRASGFFDGVRGNAMVYTDVKDKNS